MYNKKILMPHRCQKVGWVIVAIAFVIAICLFFTIVFNYQTEPTVSALLTSLVLLSATGLLLVCFSKEKNEDEYIGYLRTQILTWIIVYVFAVTVVREVMGFLLVWFASASVCGTAMTIVSFLPTNPITLGIIYLIIFRTVIWLTNRKCD